MDTMTQAEAVHRLKHRIKQLKIENAALRNENEELNEAITSIYETAAGYCKAEDGDLDEFVLDRDLQN